MVVALAAFQRRAEPNGAGDIYAVDYLVGAIFFLVRSGLNVDSRAAMKAGGDLLIQGCTRQQISRDLRDRELIEGHVGVERPDDPIAIRPDRTMAVPLKAVAVGIAGGVEPRRRPALAIAGRGEQPVEEPLVCVRRVVSDKGVGLPNTG